MINFLLSFCLGISSKLADLCGKEHGWDPFPYAGYLFGFITGVLIVYLLLNTSVPVVTLMLSVIAGLILAGKIDTPHHLLAIFISLLFIPLVGFPKIDYPLFLFFTLVNVLEEWVNDKVPKIKKMPKPLSKVLDLRPLLEISAFLISLWIQDLSLWFMLFSFDIGYQLTSRMPVKH